MLEKRGISTIILAAGKGTRMESDLAKVLHPVCGKPMLHYSIKLARDIGSEKIVVVVGHQNERIKELFAKSDLTFVHQKEQLGTAHAVLQARENLRNFDGITVILCGDVPLLLPSTVEHLIERHRSHNAILTVLTALMDDPANYGRVVKERGDTVLKIVEAGDASEEEKEIKEINTGIYCVDSRFLFDAVNQIGNDNAQGEYYLTDIFEIARKQNRKTVSSVIDNPVEAMGINTLKDLERANEIMKNNRAYKS